MSIQEYAFEVPQDLNASLPPERRGLRRDFVKMMVLDKKSGRTAHTRFFNLDQYLKAGDLLVLNTSRTVPAVLHAEWRRKDSILQEDVEIRLARRLNDHVWEALAVVNGIDVGDSIIFSNTLEATVISSKDKPFVTLQFNLVGSKLYDQIYAIGEPIRYEYIDHPWGLEYYQTVFATSPGSVEMPSAGRAFSWELLFKLQRKGIRIAYIQLHTGLSYLLDDRFHQLPELNFESFEIPQETASAIIQTKQNGGRVIAVGTTVVRALETAVDRNGQPEFKTGWTNIHIHEQFPLQIADGLITGLHEPEASHLDLLSAFIQKDLLHDAYLEAIHEGYLWHEFGDVNLIL